MRLFLITLIILSLEIFPAHALFQKVDNLAADDFRKVLISPFNAGHLYLLSTEGLFSSTDVAGSWQQIFIAQGQQAIDFCLDEYQPGVAYLLTDSAVYKISDGDKKKIFSMPPEVTPRVIAQNKGTLFVGSDSGLYYSPQQFWHWRRVPGLAASLDVYSLDFSEDKIYLASSGAVYSGSEVGDLTKDFILKTIDKETADEAQELKPNLIRVDIFNSNRIYLATTQGLYISRDAGKTWQQSFALGFRRANIYNLAQTKLSPRELYLASDRGLFVLDLSVQQSRTLFEGLPTSEIFGLDISRNGVIYLATAAGLFRQEYFNYKKNSAVIDRLTQYEPSIRQIQKQALRYNEVHPEKIARWRKRLKYRAILPELSVDYDNNIHYDSGSDVFYTGPEEWGASLSWDLGDLIWNTYEDDIDTRSRLVTQLRINILDDINAIYFQRLRLKQLLATAELSDKERLEKELRLRELTAALDGYTGGYFSRQCRRLK
jgi:hypothetical protein